MATKYLIGLVLLFATTISVADHTIQHNSDRINQQRDIRSSEDRRLDAGVALSNSLGSHQYDFDHGGPQLSIGLGGFRGESGASLGFAIKPSDNTLLNMQGGKTSEGDEGASMSLNFKF